MTISASASVTMSAAVSASLPSFLLDLLIHGSPGACLLSCRQTQRTPVQGSQRPPGLLRPRARTPTRPRPRPATATCVATSRRSGPAHRTKRASAQPRRSASWTEPSAVQEACCRLCASFGLRVLQCVQAQFLPRIQQAWSCTSPEAHATAIALVPVSQGRHGPTHAAASANN